MDRETDFPQALGVAIGLSGIDIDLLAEVNWGEAVWLAVQHAALMGGKESEEMQESLSNLIGLGVCTPSDALTLLRQHKRI